MRILDILEGWYDKKGNPIRSYDELTELSKDSNYKIVGRNKLKDGKIVSTVWLGLDHNRADSGNPLIFETMVFPSEDDFSDLDCERYSTEEEAIKGHEAMLRKWQAR